MHIHIHVQMYMHVAKVNGEYVLAALETVLNPYTDQTPSLPTD